MQEQESDKATPIRAWGTGGPLTPTQRKEAKALFLEELKRVHCAVLACEYAGIDRSTVYRWKEKEKAFAEAWNDAVERSHDIARSSIFQRGILGWDERAISNGQAVYDYESVLDANGEPELDNKGKPVYKRGEPVMVHKYSDSLAALYARANLPEYKDKQSIDIKLQMAEQDARDKEELLAGLAVAIAHEDKEQASQG